MKLIITLTAILSFTSCAKLNRILDGTENLPSQIEETNKGMRSTNESIRKQKIGEAMKIMLEENNRLTLSPIPSNMMSAAKTMAEALTVDEALLFIKNYLIKVNEEVFEDTYPLAAMPEEPQPGDDGKIDPVALSDYNKGVAEYMNLKVKFFLNKAADLQMITLISGFLPDATVEAMVAQESEQGTYRAILFQILKMRVNFYSDVMLEAGMIGGDKKLETLGQIDKATEYTNKIDYVCNLEFVDQIALTITGFDEKKNESLSRPLDKDLALAKWKKVLEKAQSGFKAQSFSKDPAKNEAAVKEYAAKYKQAIAKLQAKVDSYSKQK